MMSGDQRENAVPVGASVFRYCGRLIEAAWLVTVVVIPMLYDPFGTAGFDPIKIVTLRALGLVVAMALAVEIAVGWRRVEWRWPFWSCAVGLLALSLVVSSIFSINPARSWWGSEQHLQGAWTGLCVMALFVGIATHLRTMSQVERLVTVTLAATVPVTVCAVLQGVGFDPVGVGSLGGGAYAFAGHPIYLAGYVGMLIPLAIWQLWRLGAGGGHVQNHRWMPWAGVLLLLVIALILTGKRGPVVAVIGGGTIGLFLLAARTQRVRLAAWGVGILGGGAAFFMLLAVLVTVKVPVAEIPVVGRFARIVPVGSGTGDFFRSSIWSAAPPLVTGEKAVIFPDGSVDALAAARPWVGFGSETLQQVLPQSWLFLTGGPLVPHESWFHNGFWDGWQSLGLLGVAAGLLLCFALFRLGMQTSGMSVAARRWEFAGWTLAGGALGAGLMGTVFGAAYVGMGFPLGLLGGMVVGAVWGSFRKRRGGVSTLTAKEGLSLALLSGLAIHWVDLVFAFPTAQTLTMFWVLAGSLIALQKVNWVERWEDPMADSGGPGMLAGVLSGLILITMVNGFFDLVFVGPKSGWGVLGE